MRKSKVIIRDLRLATLIKVSKSSFISSCDQTKSNALSSTSTTANNTEKDQNDKNNLHERTMSVGSKDSDKVASNIKIYPDNLYDRIHVQVSGPVDGIKPKTVHQYNKTTLRSRKKSERNLTRGKPMFSRAAKQGLLALGRENDEKHCSGSEKNALPVVLVGTKSRMKPQANMAGTKPVTSKQTREEVKQQQKTTKEQRGPASGKIDNTNTSLIVGLEKVAPPIPARKIKAPATILRAAADGRFNTRLVTPGWMQRHVTDCAIVASKDEFDRSQNSALDQGVMASSWVKCPGAVVINSSK